MPRIIRRTVRRTRLIPRAVVIQPTPVVAVIQEEVLVRSDGQLDRPARIVETILPVEVHDPASTLVLPVTIGHKDA